MNDTLQIFARIGVYAIELLVLVGVFFLFRKLLQKRSCSTILLQFIGGIFLILGGVIFLYPGLEMTRSFAGREQSTGLDVVFTDTPFFLGSPEAWIAVGVILIIAGIYTLYRFFKGQPKEITPET